MKEKAQKIVVLLLGFFAFFLFFQPASAQSLDLGGYLSEPCDVESDYYFHIEDYEPYPYQEDTLSILGCVARPTGNLCPLYEGYSPFEIYSYYIIPEGLNNGSQTSERMWCPLYEWQEEYTVFQNNVTNTGLGVYKIITSCLNYNYDTGDMKSCYIDAGTVEILSSEDPPEYIPPSTPSTPSAIDGVCGAYNGQTMTFEDFSPYTSEGKCSAGVYHWPSFTQTQNHGYWYCSGTPQGVGESDFCSVDWENNIGDIELPEMPEIEDCDGYGFPDQWICEIRNWFTTAVLPSEEAINDLNDSIASIGNKAPFNYMRAASNSISNAQANVNAQVITFSMLGNTGEIDVEDVPLRNIIYNSALVIIIVGFIAWAIRYIKEFF